MRVPDQRLHEAYPDLIGLEMETFHLLHLARCSKGVIVASGAAICVRGKHPCFVPTVAHGVVWLMCLHQLANRMFTDVVSTEDLEALERAGGAAALQALIDYPLPAKVGSFVVVEAGRRHPQRCMLCIARRRHQKCCPAPCDSLVTLVYCVTAHGGSTTRE
jgi:hypothetical protein